MYVNNYVLILKVKLQSMKYYILLPHKKLTKVPNTMTYLVENQAQMWSSV